MNTSGKSSAGFAAAILVAVIALVAGIGLYIYLQSQQPPQEIRFVREDGGNSAMQQGTKRPDFTLADLDGKKRSISEWDGKVVLVNFWATWCPPCRREMPAFIELKEAYAAQGFEIVGIAIDNVPAVREFAEQIGVNYPLLQGQADATEVIKSYGNQIGALPYSVLLDRDGNVHLTRAGELHKEELEEALKSLL